MTSELPTLTVWFADLLAHGEQRGGFLARAAADARVLLADQRRTVVLHGDVHHGNVLDFGAAGWLAIDPKGIVGDPVFDYLNLFCNPTPELAVRPGGWPGNCQWWRMRQGATPRRCCAGCAPGVRSRRPGSNSTGFPPITCSRWAPKRSACLASVETQASRSLNARPPRQFECRRADPPECSRPAP